MQAQAMERLAAATLMKGKAEAEARQLALAAENITDTKLILRDVAMKLIDRSPELVRELMTPVTAISDVKVLQVNGLNSGDGVRSSNNGAVGTVIRTLFDASALAPVMKSLLEFGGISPEAIVNKAKEAVRGSSSTETQSSPKCSTGAES
jgi:uncharacterized membrane protein YqiK